MAPRTFDGLSGRELDAAVALHVFRFEVEERANARMRERYWVCRKPGRDWTRTVSFSRGMGPSLAVEYELHKRGWTRTEPHERTSGETRVVLEPEDGRTVEAFGPGNEALCRAALKAVAQ